MAALQNLIQGFAFSFDLNCYLMAALGTLLGIIIGALPGLTATTGVTASMIRSLIVLMSYPPVVTRLHQSSTNSRLSPYALMYSIW